MSFGFGQVRKFPNVTGIGGGNVANAQIPLGGTFYSLWIHCLASDGVTELTASQIKADIDKVTLKANGVPIIDCSATDLLFLQQFYGAHDIDNNATGILPLFFARKSLIIQESQATYALGTADISSLTVDIQCHATLANLGVIEVFGSVTNEQRLLGQHIRVQKFTYNFATTGIHEVPTLPKDALTGLLALHTQLPGSTTMTNQQILVDNNIVYDNVPQSLANGLLAHSGRQTQSGFYSVAFDRQNTFNDFLPLTGIQDLRVRSNFATAAPNNYYFLTEKIFGLKPAK